MTRPIDIIAIERQARELRAREIQRLSGLFVARLALMGRLAAGTVLSALGAVSELLRPLFAWDPQHRHSH